jgi:hypothetical protein
MAAEYEHRLLALTPESVLKCEQLMNQTAIHRSPDGQGGQNDFFLAIVLKDTTAPPADSVVIRYCAFGSCNQTDMIHQFASACAQKLKQIDQPPDHQPSQLAANSSALAANSSALNIRLICAGNDAGVLEAKKRIAEEQERIAEARGQQDATGDPLNTSASSTQQKKPRSRLPSTATLQTKWTEMFKNMFSSPAEGDGAQLFVMGAIVLQRSRIHCGLGRAVVKPFSLGYGAVQNLPTDFMSETAYGLFCGSSPVADDAPPPKPLSSWNHAQMSPRIEELNEYASRSEQLQEQLDLFACVPRGSPIKIGPTSRDTLRRMRVPSESRTLDIASFTVHTQCLYWRIRHKKSPAETARLVRMNVSRCYDCSF